MEQLLSYETAKHLLVYTGFSIILTIDIWCIILVITSAFKWVIRKIKSFISKLSLDSTNKTNQEL